MKYDIVVRPLPEEKGGGYVGLVPDLQGCMSDGETPEEAISNTLDAIAEWLETNEKLGREAPAPGWAARNAKEEKEALKRAIHILSGDLNNRIDDMEAKVMELQKVLAEIHEISAPRSAYIAGPADFGGKMLESCH